VLTSAPLAALPDVRHAFFTREGGVSGGLYASLNCGLGSDDEAEAVRENRRLAAERLGTSRDRLLTCYQIHSPRVLTVDGPWAGTPEKADGLVTRTRGLALGMLAADCAPVLFADAEAGVVGAAHAGWKGAVGGVLQATVAAMEGLGARPERIVATIGPCIAQDSYEVGEEFPAPFLAQSADNGVFFRRHAGSGRWHFDLKGYCADRLSRAGVGRVDVLPHDTCADEDRFFSYRRATRRGEPDYGRALSAILLAA